MVVNPVLVEAIRGPLVESVHRGRIAVVDRGGRRIVSIGDVDGLVYPRSAVKALQALPLIETGAAREFGLTKAEIALCCASHNGEPDHIDTVRSILAKSGGDEGALECGRQPPRRDDDLASLHRASQLPRPIHNNCSGKHAGFIALARHLGVDPAGYSDRDHPVQKTVKAALETMLGADLSRDLCAVDGCSVPTYAVPLAMLADGFSRFASGRGLNPETVAACREIYAACVEEPFMVAGTDRFCTKIMRMFACRVFVKTGAEGVYTAAFRDTGIGVALKCDDGASRAAEVTMAAIIDALVPMSDDERRALRPLVRPVLRNWRKTAIGELRPADDVFDAIRGIAG